MYFYCFAVLQIDHDFTCLSFFVFATGTINSPSRLVEVSERLAWIIICSRWLNDFLQARNINSLCNSFFQTVFEIVDFHYFSFSTSYILTRLYLMLTASFLTPVHLFSLITRQHKNQCRESWFGCVISLSNFFFPNAGLNCFVYQKFILLWS